MTTTTNNNSIQHALAKINQEIETLKRKKNNHTAGVHRYSAEQDPKYVHVAKTLVPIIKAFKRDGDRLIFPNGARVRIGKIRFKFTEQIKKPNASWGDYLFHASTDNWDSVIYFSFKEIFPALDKETPYLTNTREYHFNPCDFHMILSYCDFLKSNSNEEIEQIALYGFRTNKKAFEDKIVREEIDKELKTLNSIQKQLKQIDYYESKKEKLLEMANDESKRDRVAADWIGHGSRSLR